LRRSFGQSASKASISAPMVSVGVVPSLMPCACRSAVQNCGEYGSLGSLVRGPSHAVEFARRSRIAALT
jgi:hypothetical protein